MKNKIILTGIATAITIIFSCSVVKAQQAMKIGYVDVQKVSESYTAAKEAFNALKKKVDDKDKEAAKKEAELKNMYKTYQDNQKMYTEKALKEMEEKIMKMDEENKRYYKQALRELTEENEKLTKKIIAKILEAASTIGKQENFTYIFEKNSLIYGGEDITDKVIKLLNQEKK
jgi:outer membrane protein